LRPKLRTLISEVYKDVSYALDDEAYSAAEYQDVVRKRFIKAWEGLVDGFKVCIEGIAFRKTCSFYFGGRIHLRKATIDSSLDSHLMYSFDHGRNS